MILIKLYYIKEQKKKIKVKINIYKLKEIVERRLYNNEEQREGADLEIYCLNLQIYKRDTKDDRSQIWQNDKQRSKAISRRKRLGRIQKNDFHYNQKLFHTTANQLRKRTQVGKISELNGE